MTSGKNDRSGFLGSRGWIHAALAIVILAVAAACSSASASSIEELQNALEAGHGPDYYWQEIEELGYEITSVNYDNPGYVEYEVVRGDESLEVQLQLDDERNARRIEVTGNAWLADDTAEAVDSAPAEAPVAAVPDTVEVPAGTQILVETEGSLSSETGVIGEQVGFRVVESIAVGEKVLIPSGSAFYGRVVEVEKAERPQKPGKLGIDIDTLSVRGVQRDVAAEFKAKGRGSHKEDATEIGIGAAAGAILGAIVDGKKGAIAGIVLGGGGVFLATKGEDVVLPAGTRLTIQLLESVQVPAAS